MGQLTVPILTGSKNGFVSRLGASWPPSGTVTVDTGSANAAVQKTKTATQYAIQVALLFFDTSQVPDNAIVQAVTLRFYLADYFNSQEPTRTLKVDWYVSDGVIDAGDYTDAEQPGTAHAGLALSNLAGGVPRLVELPLVNVASLNKTGESRFRLTLSGGAPSGGSVVENIVQIATTRHPSLPEPELSITYKMPPIQTAAGSGSGAGAVAPSAARPRKAAIPWRVALCDLAGVPISLLTTVARDKELAIRLNRPETMSFTVPSNSPKVAQVHTDGWPRLTTMRRLVKAWRWENTGGGYGWKLRFAGRVWQVADGDDDSNPLATKVVCYGPMQELVKRFTEVERTYQTSQVSMIAKDLVDMTNQLGPTGITTGGGSFEVTPAQSVVFDRKAIAASVAQLADSFAGFDVAFDPLDRTDGIYARMHCYDRLGMTQPALLFGWRSAPHNLASAGRLEDGTNQVNTLTGIGLNGLEVTFQNADSVADLRRLEDVATFSDIGDRTFLSALTQEEFTFRSAPRELVPLVPLTGKAWEPFTHYHVGDTVPLRVGKEVRGGFAGFVRIYGFTIPIDDEGIERVSEILVSQGGT